MDSIEDLRAADRAHDMAGVPDFLVLVVWKQVARMFEIREVFDALHMPREVDAVYQSGRCKVRCPIEVEFHFAAWRSQRYATLALLRINMSMFDIPFLQLVSRYASIPKLFCKLHGHHVLDHHITKLAAVYVLNDYAHTKD